VAGDDFPDPAQVLAVDRNGTASLRNFGLVVIDAKHDHPTAVVGHGHDVGGQADAAFVVTTIVLPLEVEVFGFAYLVVDEMLDVCSG
jgi:hypothetical protein